MTYSVERELAYRGDAAGLRKLALEILAQDPSKTMTADAIELMAFLVEGDYAGAEAKIPTFDFKYAGRSENKELSHVLNFARAFIAFNAANFSELERLVEIEYQAFQNGDSSLEAVDVLQMFRLKAAKHFLLNEDLALKEIAESLEKFDVESNREYIYFLSNAIRVLHLSTRGEHRAALKLCEINLALAEEKSFKGVISAIDILYIKGNCLAAMAQLDEGVETFENIATVAKESSIWPWYFMADGQVAKQFGSTNRITEALARIRDERDLISTFRFENGLSFIPDASELYIRTIIKDVERVEVLVNRLPDMAIVRQVKANVNEWAGRDILGWIKRLPIETPRQVLYQLIAYAEYYRDKESVAVDYMHQAMIVAEETGSTEFLLRQHKLFEIMVKAASIKPTAYQEDIVRRVSNRVAEHKMTEQPGLPVPLSKRELEILKHLSTGKTIASIGETLNISMNTMKTHVKSIYRKLDVNDREDALSKSKSLLLI